MQTITTIGLDIAKSVFQVHGVDAVGQVVVRRQLKRRYVLAFFQKLPSCLVGIEGEGVAAARHQARRGANGRTRGLALCRCLLVGRPRERALARSLRDLNPVREMGEGRSEVSSGV